MAKNDTPAANAGSNQGGAGSSLKGKNGSSAKSGENIDGLEVSSTRDGFRRAGLSWSKKPTVVALADLTEDQVAMLKADPVLKVREVEMPADAENDNEGEDE